jgi:hypothetical protein
MFLCDFTCFIMIFSYPMVSLSHVYTLFPMQSKATASAHLFMQCWAVMLSGRLFCGRIYLIHHLTTFWRHLGGLTLVNSLVIATKHLCIQKKYISWIFRGRCLIIKFQSWLFQYLAQCLLIIKQRKYHGQETQTKVKMPQTIIFFPLSAYLLRCVLLSCRG